MEIIFKPTYGIIKHNMSNEGIAELLQFFVEEESTLLFSFYERNLHLFDEDTQNFILDRCVFRNSEWVLPWEESIVHWDEPNKTPPKLIWFSATQSEEIIKAIKIDYLFRCVVVRQGANFKQYSNVLFHQEYYSSVDEEDFDYYLGFTDRDYCRETLADELIHIKR